jgi:tubulin polyglutamylase TTLL1
MAPSSASPPLLWRSDFDKFVVTANFQRRGWHRWHANHDSDWNVYWANVHTTREIFSPENGIRLGEHQVVNHFPNHYELTRKDLLVKNVKRYRKDLEREAIRRGEDPTVASSNASSTVDFLPPTFVLPGEYALFAEAFKRDAEKADAKASEKGRGDAQSKVDAKTWSRANVRGVPTDTKASSTWIMKPAGKAQGKGIFLINSLRQVKRWASAAYAGGVHNGVSHHSCAGGRDKEEVYVVSRYVDDPLLVGGKKFDLRVYAVVTSFRPLKAYVSGLGFARFCGTKYTPAADDSGDLRDLHAHLTNVAVQKRNETTYNTNHGGKWSLRRLRVFLEHARGKETTDALFRGLHAVILKSLRSVQNVMHNDPRCFELYGYDLLIDADLKPWLIEVNASPSLSTTTDDDRDLKLAVIRDALAVAVPEAGAVDLGALEVLADDAAEEGAARRARERRERGAGRWAKR